MLNQEKNTGLRIGYLMQNGAPDLKTQSGPQLHTLAVINGLQKIGHQVRTLAIQNRRFGWSDDLEMWSDPQFSFTKKGYFRLIESAFRRVQYKLKLPFWGLFDSLHFGDACYNLFKEYDLLYERHGYLGYGGLLASKWLKIPLIIELNGNIIQEIDENGVKMSSIQRSLGRWLTYQTWSTSSHIIVVSESLRQHLIKDLKIPDNKISVVLNGVNIDLFTKCYDKQQVRGRYGIETSPIIAFVGCFDPWHGVDFLISSFKKVLSEYPTSKLLLVGDGNQYKKIVFQIENLSLEKNVILTGRLSNNEVSEILSIADVVVAPYPYKHSNILGTPLKLLEYMAASKAIVASTAPIHDLIVDGTTGLRVEPANIDALAVGISKLLGDDELRRQLGNNAHDHARINFSWDIAVEKINGIMIDLLTSQNGHEKKVL